MVQLLWSVDFFYYTLVVPYATLVEILLSRHAELDALEADMGFETEGDGVPSYLQPDKDSDLESELNLPSAPSGHGPNPAGRANMQVIYTLLAK